MRLSIITINYNNCEGLRRTIESVVNQTCRDFEYIIIDGGSTDGSVDVIKQYADQIDYWVSEPDKGIYNAMNKGVAVAKGEYCLFMNSGDCLYNELVIEETGHQLHDDDIITGKVLYDNGRIFSCPDAITLDFFNNSTLHHQGSFIKTSLQNKYPYREDFKISADKFFFVNVLIFKDASYRKIDELISLYDTSGISSANMEFGKQEADMIFRYLMPPRLYEDFCAFHGKTDEYNKLFYNISKTPHKWTFYNMVVKFLKIVLFNKSWVKELRIHKGNEHL